MITRGDSLWIKKRHWRKKATTATMFMSTLKKDQWTPSRFPPPRRRHVVSRLLRRHPTAPTRPRSLSNPRPWSSILGVVLMWPLLRMQQRQLPSTRFMVSLSLCQKVPVTRRTAPSWRAKIGRKRTIIIMQRATIFSSLRLGRWRLPCAYESNEIIGTFENEVHSPESSLHIILASNMHHHLLLTSRILFGRLERERENETTHRKCHFWEDRRHHSISSTWTYTKSRTLHSRYESHHCTNIASTHVLWSKNMHPRNERHYCTSISEHYICMTERNTKTIYAIDHTSFLS